MKDQDEYNTESSIAPQQNKRKRHPKKIAAKTLTSLFSKIQLKVRTAKPKPAGNEFEIFSRQK